MLGAAAPAFAQTTGRVSGRVSNEVSPLRGVTVIALRGEETVKTAITDDQGAYAIDGLEAGTFSLAFTMGPYADYADRIVVRAGEKIGRASCRERV